MYILYLANKKHMQQESEQLILLVQKDVYAHFNKIMSQNDNVIKFICVWIII